MVADITVDDDVAAVVATATAHGRTVASLADVAGTNDDSSPAAGTSDAVGDACSPSPSTASSA